MDEYVEAQEGEHGYYFEFTLRNADRTIYVLGGTETVALRIALPGNDGKAVGSGEVWNAEGGMVRVTITASESAKLTKARYEAQIQILESGGAKKVITRPFELRIGRGI